MDKYLLSSPIDSESIATVYKGTHGETGRKIVVKAIPIVEDEDEGVPIILQREISLLQGLRHENIVSLLDVVYESECVNLIFEALDGDLENHFQTHWYFMRPHVRSFLIQILTGVDYCHSRQILHRDLKPSNILVDWKNKIIKLADFGMAREYMSDTPKSYTLEVQSLCYRAPELLLGLPRYTRAIDIWSVGCIFAELVRGEPLFGGQVDIQQLQSIISIMGTPTEETWAGVTELSPVLAHLAQTPSQDLASLVPSLEPAGVDLLSKMLCMDPARRITAEEALHHRYLQ